VSIVSSEREWSQAKREALWVCFFLTGALTLLGFKLPNYWLAVFFATATWSIEDFLIDKFITGSRGAPHIVILKRLRNRISKRSWVYVVYFCGILCVSVLADAYSRTALLFVTIVSQFSTNKQLVSFGGGSLLTSALVFFDLRFRFYNRAKRKRRVRKNIQKG
jgi:hypothetical protein